MALRVKRSLELDSLTDALPIGSSIGVAYRATPPKRARNEEFTGFGGPAHSSPAGQQGASAGAHGAADSQGHGNGHGGAAAHSPFHGRKMDGGDLDSLLSSCVQGVTGKDSYTGEEVRAIVQTAVSAREDELRAEYDAILQQKLKEQFNSFTKFNQDFISRQMKGNPFSYVS